MFDRLWTAIGRILPSICIVCGQSANRQFSICRDCDDELPRMGECCRRCGIEFEGRLSHNSCCASCRLTPPAFESCNAAFPYVSPINKLVADFKFSARFDIGYSLSRVLARKFNAHYRETNKPDFLLPVPAHRSRLSERGFNQALEICNVLSSHSRVPSLHSALRKVRNTQPQTSMASAAARRGNLHNAFTVNRADSLEGARHIALVDDVVTTMATVEAVSRLLRAQLGCRVDVWCLARAGR